MSDLGPFWEGVLEQAWVLGNFLTMGVLLCVGVWCLWQSWLHFRAWSR